MHKIQHPKFSVRRAEVQDAPSLAEIHVSYAKEFNLCLEVSDIHEGIRRNLEYCISSPEYTVLVAETGEEGMIGYIHVCWHTIMHYMGSEGQILDMLVKKDFRGRGLGTKFLTMVEREALKRGCLRLVLNNYRSFDSYQRGFYKRRNFIEEDIAYFSKHLDFPT